MVTLIDSIEGFGNWALPLARTVLVVILLFVIFNILLGIVRRALLKNAKRKNTISNIEIFTRIIRYSFVVVLIIFAVLAYGGSFTGIGLAAGLMTAALGWALQRPITGMAAWIMIVVKRPFQIGDRIIVAGVKGDVVDISLTHIYLGEVGGIANSEERSGRVIMVPNSILFEQNIINFTHESDFILDEVVVTVTYESNLDKAIEIGVASAETILNEFNGQFGNKPSPYVRTYFQQNGIDVRVRYFTPAMRRQEISSKITQEMFRRINNADDVTFAYQHSEVVFKDKGLFKGKKG